MWKLDAYIAIVRRALDVRTVAEPTDHIVLVAEHSAEAWTDKNAASATVTKEEQVPFAYSYVPERDGDLDVIPHQEAPAVKTSGSLA